MLVVSMNDFLGNPAQYVEKAHHTAVLIENTGSDPIKLTVRKSIISKLVRILNVKKIKAYRDKKDIEYINDNAERMNAEMAETLEFQTDIWENAE